MSSYIEFKHTLTLDLIHVTCHARSDTAKADITPYEQLIFQDSNDILCSMYFNIPSCLVCNEFVDLPSNMHIACGPYFELDYDESIKQVNFCLLLKVHCI